MFEEAHETLEELHRLFSGQMSPAEADRVAEHLASCRECWLLATRAIAAQQATGAITLQPPLRLLVELHEVERARLEEGLEAQALWANLLRLSPKARREKVRLSRSLHTLGFLRVLLEEGAMGGPSESEELFYLAVLVAGQLPSLRFSVELKHDLCAESYAELANAHLGSTQEALLRFNVLKRLHDQFREPLIQLRVRFTAGLLLEHLGRNQKAVSLFEEVIAGDLEHGLVKNFFLDLVYLFGFHLRKGQTSEAIALCRRAGQELSLLEDEEGSGETARDQMREVWRSLEEEVRKGTVGLGATTVLRNYIKAHWRTPASEPPSFQA
jgi:hypothetical protein